MCLLPVFLLFTGDLFAQSGSGIQSAINIESHISFMSVLRGLLGIATLILYRLFLNFLEKYLLRFWILPKKEVFFFWGI